MTPLKRHFSEFFVQTSFGQMFTRSHTTCNHPDVDLVLVHGMIISGSYMMPLAQCLAGEYRVFVPDLPGYGRSDKPEQILSIEELADALIAWMDAISLSKVHFVANSFGCQIIADLAVRYPDRVETLVLQGPTVDAHARHLWWQALRMKINSYRESKSVGMISARDYKSAGLWRVIKTISMTLKDHIEEKLPQVVAPTLIVRGADDPVVPQAWALEVVHLLPHGKLVVIPKAAHTLNYSEANRFAEVIQDFLRQEISRKEEGTNASKSRTISAENHWPVI